MIRGNVLFHSLKVCLCYACDINVMTGPTILAVFDTADQDGVVMVNLFLGPMMSGKALMQV